MADTGRNFPVSRIRFHFWYFGVLRLIIGLAQIIAVVWCVVLFLEDGFGSRTMHAVFFAAGITTVSLFLFRVLGGHFDAASNSEAPDCANEKRWKFRGSAIPKN
jgi:hypothetical protein